MALLSDSTSSVSFPWSEDKEGQTPQDVMIFDVSDTVQDEVFLYVFSWIIHNNVTSHLGVSGNWIIIRLCVYLPIFWGLIGEPIKNAE